MTRVEREKCACGMERWAARVQGHNARAFSSAEASIVLKRNLARGKMQGPLSFLPILPYSFHFFPSPFPIFLNYWKEPLQKESCGRHRLHAAGDFRSCSRVLSARSSGLGEKETVRSVVLHTGIHNVALQFINHNSLRLIFILFISSLPDCSY